MITLSLDLAGQTGWAIRYETGVIRTGIWTLTRGNLGGSRSTVPMLRLWKRLNKLAETHEISKIVMEQIFARGGPATFRLDSLQYTALLFAVLNKITWTRVQNLEWKSRVIGNSKASKTEYLAFARRKWPEQRIWTEDQAAALCLLEFSESFV